MAPTQEEELKLRLFSGELTQLGPAERFLKVLVDIPFAFQRLECLMFMLILREEVSSIKDSFATLEVITQTPTTQIYFESLICVFFYAKHISLNMIYDDIYNTPSLTHVAYYLMSQF
jgi:hypothetical protein